MLAAFSLWTLAVRFVDVQSIGPQGSAVGLAGMNRFFHELTGVHLFLYTITDWSGLVPLGFVFGFGLLGLIQWIRRKHPAKVDHSILVLGGFYFLVLSVFLLFEVCVVNYRPVLIQGQLEGSYPSSTTMLVLCVMPTAATELRDRIRNKVFKGCVVSGIILFTLFMVLGRLISGVHWFSDIIGGILLSGGLVGLYRAAILLKT